MSFRGWFALFAEMMAHLWTVRSERLARRASRAKERALSWHFRASAARLPFDR